MLEHLLFHADARGFTPTASESDAPGTRGQLAEKSMGDWSWKPHRYTYGGSYRLAITGPRCTCTLHQPVGTSCARHSNFF
jgi:hypothetical protein